jgi:hypothetical protein
MKDPFDRLLAYMASNLVLCAAIAVVAAVVLLAGVR